MNLMFRKNFGADKSSSGETRTGICGSFVSSGITSGTGLTGTGPTRSLGLRPSLPGVGSRGPIRRSREFGYYPMEEHATHAYRTHLFLSPPAGTVEESNERIGPVPRRNSGPHVIKWGGSNTTNAANLANNNVKRKQNGNQMKDTSEPPTPTASRQVIPD